jgi:SLT domain-containing protein
MSMNVTDVEYTQYHGEGNIEAWIAAACRAAGVPHNDAWVKGYKTLCERESSYNPNAVNITDYNANGERVGDGHPLNCSRGLAQCILPTFAAHHAESTSKSIYDPIANIAASVQYVRDNYQVSLDGSDLAKKVQQADPTRPPKGY